MPCIYSLTHSAISSQHSVNIFTRDRRRAKPFQPRISRMNTNQEGSTQQSAFSQVNIFKQEVGKAILSATDFVRMNTNQEQNHKRTPITPINRLFSSLFVF